LYQIFDNYRQLVTGQDSQQEEKEDNPCLTSVIPEQNSDQDKVERDPGLFPGNEEHGSIPPGRVHSVQLQEQVAVKAYQSIKPSHSGKC
jgi:hypothetical protein